MAQLVARLVRNEKVGGSNPPSSTTGRHPIRMSVFCMPGVVLRWCVAVAPLVFWALRCAALWGLAAVCAGGQRPSCFMLLVASRVFRGAVGPGRPRDRHTRAQRLGVVDLEARPYPPDPPAPSTPVVPVVLCAVARCLQTRACPVAAHWHRGQAPPPPTGAFGNSRETVIAFAGACSVSGETDGTIASQIQLSSALFWCAKASWVSWRRPEVPALVLMVSSHGAVSSVGAIKFAQRDLSMPIVRKYSPSAGNMAQNGRFVACRASFFAGVGGRGVCWASFVATPGTLIRPRAPPPALRSGCPVCRCPPRRRNRPRTRIGYCDMDRL